MSNNHRRFRSWIIIFDIRIELPSTELLSYGDISGLIRDCLEFTRLRDVSRKQLVVIYCCCLKTRYLFTLLNEPSQFNNFYVNIRRLPRVRFVRIVCLGYNVDIEKNKTWNQSITHKRGKAAVTLTRRKSTRSSTKRCGRVPCWIAKIELLKFSKCKRVFSYLLGNRVVLHRLRLSAPKTSNGCVGKLTDQMAVVRGPYTSKSD